jgi:SAM-dependent methyltransferase
MLLQRTLGLKEDAYLVEGSFEGLEMCLKTLDYLNSLSMLPAGSIDAAVAISDKSGAPLGVSFKNKFEGGDFWFVIPYPIAKASRQQAEKLVSAVIKGGIVASVKKKKVDAGIFKKAIREYLAVSLAEEALCECDKDREPRSFVFNEGRNERLGALLEKLAKENGFDLKQMDALEICCGNGMSTAAIKPLFKGLLCVDNDKCAICNGVYHGTLDPENVMVVDAMGLTKYVDEKYDAVVGLMLGTIYEFNKNIWRMIFEEAVRTLKDDGFLLLTVNNKEEMDFLASAFKEMGIKGSVIDNRNRNDIYDGWAFFAVKSKGRYGH